MPLSWNDIRANATQFAHDWAGETDERAGAQEFWIEFFKVFGIQRRRVGAFEKHVEKLGDKKGFIDFFWPGMLIVEHKSAGKDLEKAMGQALDYFHGLKDSEVPRYVIVSDFARLRLYDLETGDGHTFDTAELPKHIKHFGFIAGYREQVLRAEDPVNVKAAERMGKLHDALKAAGYEGHDLEMLLVRLLFCLFADDTGIFQPAQSFQLWIEERTADDGSDLGAQLNHAFQILDTHHAKRSKTLDEQLADFPYVNGDLFREPIRIASFNRAMRDALLDACALDWSRISPAVFGAMFQSIMDATARRNLGAHYTSEQNILKLIKPLFLDELWAEFERVKRNRNKLFEFHKKLRTLTFFDPACGCGNFLVVAYRELRLLELEILRASAKDGQLALDIESLITLDVDQFYGIEIEEFPARIAEVALWLTDHQMNLKIGEEFGNYFARIPIESSPHIHHGNALTMDWTGVIAPERLSYIMGNPPFIGHQWRTADQVASHRAVWGERGRVGRLDFVTCWFKKAAEFAFGDTCTAFVSTNSVAQGEQAAILWQELMSRGVRIQFAHRTFQWRNEARGIAAVHCVIIGFASNDRSSKVIYDYPTANSDPLAVPAKQINPYLVDAPSVFLPSRSSTPPGLPQLIKGSQPTDGGNLVLSESERHELICQCPGSEKWIRPYIGGREFLQGLLRYCLWLKECPPDQLKLMPEVLERVEKVRKARLESPTASVREFANFPSLFTQDRQPQKQFMLLPEVSSAGRRYIPIGLKSPETVPSNQILFAAGASEFHVGVISSSMHMAWMRTVAGRLKSDYRYSAAVYNNFPWPQNPTPAAKAKIETCAQAVLDARAEFPDATLADLYNPLTMPPVLLKAHKALDKAVDAAYAPRRKFTGDADRVAFLFEEYERITSALTAEAKPKKKRKTKQ